MMVKHETIIGSSPCDGEISKFPVRQAWPDLVSDGYTRYPRQVGLGRACPIRKCSSLGKSQDWVVMKISHLCYMHINIQRTLHVFSSS